MVAIRCTRKLLARLKAPAAECGPSTTKLGDWYADLLYLRPEQLVLLVSAESRLPLVVAARGSTTLLERVRFTLSAVLDRIDVPRPLVERELSEMTAAQFGRTASRSVLGTMNDFAFQLVVMREHGVKRDLVDWSLHLAETPCKPIHDDQPRSVARARLLGG
jgi:hypothetical protein